MARAKQTATAAPVPADDAAAAAQLGALGDVMRDRLTVRTQYEERIAKLQAEAAEHDAPLKAREAALLTGLQIWAEAHRARLTRHGATKTVKLSTGVIAWRAKPPRVEVARGALSGVLAALEAQGLEALLKRSVSLDKAAILRAPDAIGATPGLAVIAGEEEFTVAPSQLDGVAS